MFSYFQEWIISLKEGYLEDSFSQPTRALSKARNLDKEESDVSEHLQICGLEKPTPKKLGETVNKKQNYDESNLPLNLTEINYCPYCVLYSRKNIAE